MNGAMEHEEPEVVVEAPDDAATAEPAAKKAKVAGAEGPGMKKVQGQRTKLKSFRESLSKVEEKIAKLHSRCLGP